MIIKTFGMRAKAIKASARSIAKDARSVEVYVEDTANGPGEADYDLLHAARDLEEAARELRLLHARIETTRGDKLTPSRIPVHTFGH